MLALVGIALPDTPTIETPDIRSKSVAQGADPAFLASVEFTRSLGVELPRRADVVKRSGATLD